MTKGVFLTGAAVVALAVSVGATTQAAMVHGAPTPAQARAFVSKAEIDLAKESLYVNHAAWVQATYINSDTNWLVARANAESTDLAVRLAKDAARFDRMNVDDVTRRKLYLLK